MSSSIFAVLLEFGLMCACSSPPTADALEVAVRINGDEVTIEWEDPRAVHEVGVIARSGPQENGVYWRVSASEIHAFPNTEPTIVPPVTYGEPLGHLFTHSGPLALDQGVSYDVLVEAYGWGDTCVERGIEVATATSVCIIARGITSFSL
jgi:hypothetical protein